MSVLGVYGVEHASSLVYYGLHSMQHRGQEGCGMVSVEDDGTMHRHRGYGLVQEVFNEERLSKLEGTMCLGHLLYTTAGGGRSTDNIEPRSFLHNTGSFAVAHNGNIVNAKQIRAQLETKGSLFQSNTNAELLAHLIKKEAYEPRIFTIMEALDRLEGSFAFVIMTQNRLYACRDKYGIRPLAIGKLGDGYVVSSETCAFDVMGAEFLRDVEPGEIVTIDHNGLRSRKYSLTSEHNMCAMEYIYFARPDSDIDGCNVHAFRKESGRRLWREAPAEADIVVGVPDSSLSAAMGYAEASGLPYEMGLIKNKYIGRTFIQPSQALREKGVKMKLSAIRSIVEGKRIALIDDSIVRGTTSKRIVNMLREAGATEVHVRIVSPTMKYPCCYGVDTTSQDELISAKHSVGEVCNIIGADTLAFMSVKECLASSNGKCQKMCFACFDGIYPTPMTHDISEINKKK